MTDEPQPVNSEDEALRKALEMNAWKTGVDTVECFRAYLLGAARDKQPWAMQFMSDAEYALAQKRVVAFAKRHDTVTISYKGQQITKSARAGVLVRDGDSIGWQQKLFWVLTRDELMDRKRMLQGQKDGATENLAIVARLEKLLDEVPEAADTGEAAKALGTTVEKWLADAS